MTIVAIHQPMYLPYPGFFNKMKEADIFVFGDDVKFSRHYFINRNRIKTPDGTLMLTIPLKSASPKKISEIEISHETKWEFKHFRSIQTFYRKADYYESYIDFFERVYKKNWKLLIDINMETTYYLMKQLEINVEIYFTSKILKNYEFKGKTQRIIDICEVLGADVYLSGPGGKHYLEPGLFERNGIKLVYQNYAPKEYKQLYGEFIPNLSVIDLLFNMGDKAVEYI